MRITFGDYNAHLTKGLYLLVTVNEVPILWLFIGGCDLAFKSGFQKWAWLLAILACNTLTPPCIKLEKTPSEILDLNVTECLTPVDPCMHKDCMCEIATLSKLDSKAASDKFGNVLDIASSRL